MIFKNKIFAAFICALVIAGVLSCRTKNHTTENSVPLHGHYLNRTFLDGIADSLPGTIPVYCYEFNFDSGDSVNINFGFEEAKFHIEKSSGIVTIKNACAKGDLSILVNADSSLVLVDSSWTGLKTNSVFIKSTLSDKDTWHFEEALNGKFIAGKYTVDTAPTSSQISTVEFHSDGKVDGLANFIEYHICFSGDCVGLTTPLSNTIDFTDIKGNMISYAFKISQGTLKDIQLFKLGESTPDIKGEIPIKEKYMGLTEVVLPKN